MPWVTRPPPGSLVVLTPASQSRRATVTIWSRLEFNEGVTVGPGATALVLSWSDSMVQRDPEGWALVLSGPTVGWAWGREVTVPGAGGAP